MVGADCKHVYSGGGQDKQPGLGPIVRALAVMEALAVGMYYHGFTIFPGCAHAVEASDSSQSGAMQIQSWRG